MSVFKKLFLNNTTLLDLRSPIEFSQGACPNTTNIPLLTDKERELVGTCYKQQGQDTAIQLGHELVCGEIKAQRVQAWKNYFQENPKASLYCFRGGMRSHLVQQWLKEEGIEVPLIEGGYKAMRRYLIDVLEQPLNMIRISGQTGVGKTDLLVTLDDHIDLEGLANHRGSSFGKFISNQPTQINFENNLAIDLLNKQLLNKTCLVEDEGRYIGSVNLPLMFIKSMQKSPVVILTCPQEERIDRIYRDYVALQKQAYIEKHAENGGDLFDVSLLTALQNIQKRLGGKRYQELDKIMQEALRQEDESLHKRWIADLLEHYYDPMYDYQLDKKSELVIFNGDKITLKKFLTFRLNNLSLEETQVVYQCIKCVANGKIVPDDGEFSVLFGISLDEFFNTFEAWPNIDESNQKTKHAINNALNNVIGYPHDKHDKWHKVMETPISTIEKIFIKWRGD